MQMIFLFRNEMLFTLFYSSSSTTKACFSHKKHHPIILLLSQQMVVCCCCCFTPVLLCGTVCVFYAVLFVLQYNENMFFTQKASPCCCLRRWQCDCGCCCLTRPPVQQKHALYVRNTGQQLLHITPMQLMVTIEHLVNW